MKENQTNIRYLEALLQVESEERDRHAVANWDLVFGPGFITFHSDLEQAVIHWKNI